MLYSKYIRFLTNKPVSNFRGIITYLLKKQLIGKFEIAIGNISTCFI